MSSLQLDAAAETLDIGYRFCPIPRARREGIGVLAWTMD
jgi:hypothetical protein